VSQIPDKWEVSGVLKTSFCPRRNSPPDWVALTRLYKHYQNGHLWDAGGLSEQPAIFLDLMSLIDQWVGKLRD